jgi:hypothetical protein
MLLAECKSGLVGGVRQFEASRVGEIPRPLVKARGFG